MSWERERPVAKAGRKSDISGERQQESPVMLVSQPNLLLCLLLPATYRHVQAGKIPSFDCVWGKDLLVLPQQTLLAQNKISQSRIAKILG